MFGFWDWVGGRYSVDSAIGLSLMIAIGPERFAEFLAGFHLMDEHFRTAPLAEQHARADGAARGVERRRSSAPTPMPCCPTASASAASRRTSSSSTWRATASRSTSTGGRSRPAPGPIVWGEPGTNGQHAFYQLIHQGTRLVPSDLIGICRPAREVGTHQDLLMANLLAQAEALAFGKTPRRSPPRGWRRLWSLTGPSPGTGPPT